MSSKLIIGCGYLGQRVAAEWIGRGDTVYALTRTPQRAGELRRSGIEPIVGDVTEIDSLPQFPAVETALYAVGFDRNSGKSRQTVYVDGLANVLQQLSAVPYGSPEPQEADGRVPPALQAVDAGFTNRTEADAEHRLRDKPPFRRFIYISSTSVYGQNAGEWIDETSVCKPDRENGLICLAAEELLRRTFRPTGASAVSDEVTSPLVVLRLSGIYGPNRLLRRIEELRSAEPLSGNPEAFLNLIHVDDAVGAVLAADARSCQNSETPATVTQESGRPASGRSPRFRAKPPRAADDEQSPAGQLFLVSDDQPVTRRRYYELLARLVDAPPPQFSPDGDTAAKNSRRGAGAGLNKRCCNERMRRELQVELQYPTIDTGLPRAVAETGGKW